MARLKIRSKPTPLRAGRVPRIKRQASTMPSRNPIAAAMNDMPGGMPPAQMPMMPKRKMPAGMMGSM